VLVVVNEFHVIPGREAEFERLFGEVRKLILREPGCLSCRLHRERTAPNVYVSYLQWTRVEALEAPHDAAIAAIIGRYPLEAPPRRRRFDPVGEGWENIIEGEPS
jgi:quinol monooxygenase YgiN